MMALKDMVIQNLMKLSVLVPSWQKEIIILTFINEKL